MPARAKNFVFAYVCCFCATVALLAALGYYDALRAKARPWTPGALLGWRPERRSV